MCMNGVVCLLLSYIIYIVIFYPFFLSFFGGWGGGGGGYSLLFRYSRLGHMQGCNLWFQYICHIRHVCTLSVHHFMFRYYYILYVCTISAMTEICMLNY